MGLTISTLLSRLIAKKEMRILMVRASAGRARPRARRPGCMTARVCVKRERGGQPNREQPPLPSPPLDDARAPSLALASPARAHPPSHPAIRNNTQVGLDAAGKTTILYKLKLGGETCCSSSC